MKIPIWLHIVIFVVLFSLIVHVTTHDCSRNKSSVSRFLNIDAKSSYRSIVDELGEPQVLVNQEGGFAMWFPKQLDPSQPYTSVILKDEQILHNTQHQHYDFLYTTVVINIPEKNLIDVLSINKSLYYDRVTRELTVRCNSLESNKAILETVAQKLILVNSGLNITGSLRDKLDILNFQNRDLEKFSQIRQSYRKIPVSP